MTEFYTRRNSLRWQAFDYTSAVYYFVTVVVEDRRSLLSSILPNGQIELTLAGRMINDCLQKLPQQFPGFEVAMSVVMPNHIHLLLMGNGTDSLEEIMRWLKGLSASRYYRGVDLGCCPRVNGRLWQRSYYDSVVRNQRALDYISNYIYRNPERWIHDEYNGASSADKDDVLNNLRLLNR